MADSFSRNKMRWLNSIMYSGKLKATACRVAYVLADHVNKVTGDCWLSHATIARKLGISTKTVQRAIGALKRPGFIFVRYAETNPRKQRFVPSFILNSDGEPDSDGAPSGQERPPTLDAGGHQSFSKNILRSDLPQRIADSGSQHSDRELQNKFRRSSRGELEVKVAKRLGSDGFDVLNRLAEVDDRIVYRLCVAQANNRLTPADLYAAPPRCSPGAVIS